LRPHQQAHNSTNDALLDHYRCPEDLVQHAAPLVRHLPDPDGWLAKMMRTHPDWQPTQFVNHLRGERYVHNGNGGARTLASTVAAHRLYYWFRPVLPIAVRKHLQRFSLRHWSKLDFPAWPVDTTVEQVLEAFLFQSMQSRGIDRVPFVWFWPDGASACALLTHDVETPDGVAFTAPLMDFDDSFEVKAAFQVIPEKQYPVTRDFLDHIRHRGFELNVQDLTHDGNLFKCQDDFIVRAKFINRYLREFGSRGFRSGRLYRNADWLSALDIDYDMSVPNVGHLEAQRGGCCTVFPYFIGDILEIPLTTIQDYCLFHILGDYSVRLWKKQIELILKNHGMASFIVHPDYIREKRAMRLYGQLLDHLSGLRKSANVWITLPSEVDRWWRDRARMQLVQKDGGWTITGPGSQRARIAYASVVDGHIRYTVDPTPRPS
jgi:hypothetical protein